MTNQTEWSGLFGGAEPGSESVVPPNGSAPTSSQLSNPGVIHVVRFTMRPTGDGEFQIHYKQPNGEPN